jgi:hypothetical protein
MLRVLRFTSWPSIAVCAASCVPTESGSGRDLDGGGSALGSASSAASARARLERRNLAKARPLRSASAHARRPAGKLLRRGESAPDSLDRTAGGAAVGSAAPLRPGDQSSGRLREVFRDRFDRGSIGPAWNPTSPAWQVKAGRLCGQGAKNHPVWLTYELPRNARIEFDAVSSSSDGDIKAEFWGDGRSAATGASYNDATGYIAIYGGWHNRYHVLARRDEHAPDRLQVAVSEGSQDYRARPVQPHRSYHFKVERNDGKTVQWLVEDIEIHVFADPDPLVGPGHEHFGFNNWATAVCFDNVMITPLPDE